jgi:hypothetical protein
MSGEHFQANEIGEWETGSLTDVPSRVPASGHVEETAFKAAGTL